MRRTPPFTLAPSPLIRCTGFITVSVQIALKQQAIDAFVQRAIQSLEGAGGIIHGRGATGTGAWHAAQPVVSVCSLVPG
jgi:hypothetical protein